MQVTVGQPLAPIPMRWMAATAVHSGQKFWESNENKLLPCRLCSLTQHHFAQPSTTHAGAPHHVQRPAYITPDLKQRHCTRKQPDMMCCGIAVTSKLWCCCGVTGLVCSHSDSM